MRIPTSLKITYVANICLAIGAVGRDNEVLIVGSCMIFVILNVAVVILEAIEEK